MKIGFAWSPLTRLGLVNVACLMAAALSVDTFTVSLLWALALFDTWYLTELRVEARSGSSTASEEDRGSRRVLTALRDASVMLPIFWATLRGPLAPAVLTVLGTGVFLLGLTIRLHAMRALGRHFTMSLTRQSSHELLTRGLYCRMRHPGYLGLVLIYSSFSLACGSIALSMLIASISFAGILYRIRLEERLLVHTFGQRYLDYRRRTWALFPRFLGVGEK
jgi:protein-S-isoprenylcysteine O-methyltransferase Ste14